jgi:protein AaeX
MIGEISVYGIYVPWLLLLSLFALAASRVLSHLLGRLGFYRLVWHPALFDFALFIIVLGAASLVSSNSFY